MNHSTTREDEVLAGVPKELLIGGSWRASSSRSTFTVFDPATGLALAQIADASIENGAAALDAAVEAADEWARTAPRTRAAILRNAFDLLNDQREDFALLMTLEMGKPIEESRREVTYGGEFLRWFSEESIRVAGRFSESPEGNGQIIVSQHPVGPCLLITPWNFPLAMATRKIGPALAAGCTVVIKPAENAPLTTLLFAATLQRAGLPPGVVNVITTSQSREVIGPLIADPRLRKLSFTGSTEVGVALLKQAADGVLRSSMELGGNAPFIVFDDADLDSAVEGAMLAKFRNNGEACTAANRFLVHKQIAPEFASRIALRVSNLKVGRGTDPAVDIGPMIGSGSVTRLVALVEDALSRGAKLLSGGEPLGGDGYFFQPTVLFDVAPDSLILHEEIFGPILAIQSFSEEADAVRLANETPYGLVSYVYTQNLDRGLRMIGSLQTGMMGLNTGVVSNAAAPFGGMKQSGNGREGGEEGISEYLETKYTFVAK